MASDGTLNFDTKINSTGFTSGINSISGVAKTGMAAVGVAVAAAATAIVSFGVSSVQTGMEFDNAMSQVAATMGTTTDNIEELRDKAREMGKTTSFTATEAAEGMNILAMAGMNATEQIAAIDPVLRLAEAGATSMDNSAQYLVTTMNGFNMTASETTAECREMENGMSNVQYVSDLVAKGATMVVSSVDDLGTALSESSASAGAYGQTVETTTTALMGLAQGGITGGQAATYLNRIMSQLYAPTSAAAKALDELGVSAYNEAGESRDLLDVIADLSAATADMSDEQSNAYMKTILGTYGLKAYNAITSSTTEEIAAMKEEVMDCAGACEQMAETQLDNLEGDITKCKSAFSDLQIAVSDELTSSLRDFVQFGTDQIMILDDAISENGLAGGFAALGDVLSNLVDMVVQMAPSMLSAAKELINSFCEGLKDSGKSVESMSDLIVSIIDCVVSSYAEIMSTAVSLMMSFARGLVSAIPQVVEAAVGMIPQLCNGIEAHMSTFSLEAVSLILDFVDAMLGAITELAPVPGEIVTAIVNGLTEMLPTLTFGAVQMFTGIIDAIPITIDGILSSLPDIIDAIVNFMVEAIPDLIEAAVQMLNAIIEAIPQIVTAITENLPQIIDSIVNGLVSAAPQILQGAITLFMAIIQAIPTIVSSLAGSLPQIITTIVSALANAIPQVLETAKNLLGQVVEAIPTVVSNLAGAIPNIITGIVNGLMNGIGAVFDAAASLGAGILDGIKGFLGINSPSTVMTEQGEYITEGLVRGIEDMPAECMAYFDSLTDFIVAWGANLAEVVSNAAQITTTQLAAQFEQLPQLINGYLNESLSGINEWGSSMNAAMSAAINEALAGVANTFAQLPTQVSTYLNQTVSVTTSFGSALSSSLTSGTTNAVDAVAKAFSQLPTKVNTYLTQTTSKATSWGSSLANSMKSTATNAVNNVASCFSQLPTKVNNYLTQTTNKVNSWGTNLTNSMKTCATNCVNNVATCFSQLPTKVNTYLTQTTSKVTSWSSQMANLARQAGSNFVSQMSSGMSSLSSKVGSALSSAVSKARSYTSTMNSAGRSIGSNLVQGMINGINSKSGSLYSTISSVVNRAVAKANSAAGTHSPSTKMEWTGEMMDKGLANGLEKFSNMVDMAMEDVMSIVEEANDVECSPDMDVTFDTDSIIDAQEQVEKLMDKMQAAVNVVVGSIALEKAAESNYGAYTSGAGQNSENEQPYQLNAEIHTHVELDGKEVGEVMTPYVDTNMGRSAKRIMRGG